jgi:uncharacterized damage-inducible protein DinB
VISPKSEPRPWRDPPILSRSWRPLEETPLAYARAYAQLGDEAFHQRPADGGWSAAEQLVHVVASDAIVAPRVWQVLLRPGQLLPAYDERALGRRLAHTRVAVADRLQAFAGSRRALLGLLTTLDESDWELAGRHEERGDMTIRDICDSILIHETGHVAQLETTVEFGLGRCRLKGVKDAR